jgi:hypothetical protein
MSTVAGGHREEQRALDLKNLLAAATKCGEYIDPPPFQQARFCAVALE